MGECGGAVKAAVPGRFAVDDLGDGLGEFDGDIMRRPGLICVVSECKCVS